VRPGDVLASGDHWVVLVTDDGDGTLDPGDRVAHCWRRPATVERLDEALGVDTTALEHLRHEGGLEPS
jgi:hypothetical protein